MTLIVNPIDLDSITLDGGGHGLIGLVVAYLFLESFVELTGIFDFGDAPEVEGGPAKEIG